MNISILASVMVAAGSTTLGTTIRRNYYDDSSYATPKQQRRHHHGPASNYHRACPCRVAATRVFSGLGSDVIEFNGTTLAIINDGAVFTYEVSGRSSGNS